MFDRLSQELPCATVDPDLFFPPTYTGVNRQRVEYAKDLCRGCRLQEPCLEAALASDEQSGIWGGLTPDERLRIAALRRLSEVS